MAVFSACCEKFYAGGILLEFDSSKAALSSLLNQSLDIRRLTFESVIYHMDSSVKSELDLGGRFSFENLLAGFSSCFIGWLNLQAKL